MFQKRIKCVRTMQMKNLAYTGQSADDDGADVFICETHTCTRNGACGLPGTHWMVPGEPLPAKVGDRLLNLTVTVMPSVTSFRQSLRTT